MDVGGYKRQTEIANRLIQQRLNSENFNYQRKFYRQIFDGERNAASMQFQQKRDMLFNQSQQQLRQSSSDPNALAAQQQAAAGYGLQASNQAALMRLQEQQQAAQGLVNLDQYQNRRTSELTSQQLQNLRSLAQFKTGDFNNQMASHQLELQKSGQILEGIGSAAGTFFGKPPTPKPK